MQMTAFRAFIFATALAGCSSSTSTSAPSDVVDGSAPAEAGTGTTPNDSGTTASNEGGSDASTTSGGEKLTFKIDGKVYTLVPSSSAAVGRLVISGQDNGTGFQMQLSSAPGDVPPGVHSCSDIAESFVIGGNSWSANAYFGGPCSATVTENSAGGMFTATFTGTLKLQTGSGAATVMLTDGEVSIHRP